MKTSTKTAPTILKTENRTWGFWGTCSQNAWNTTELWNAASVALAKHFKLSPEMVRAVLDSRTGRWLGDELSYIKGGVINRHTVTKYLDNLFDNTEAARYWRKMMSQTVRELRAEGAA